MTLLLVYALIAAGHFIHSGSTESISEDDGFRRLLRRASAEADRPLIREQRRNKVEDDEDLGNVFETAKPVYQASHNDEDGVLRKRREDEDKFYHTLLNRAQPNRKEKRSFDTGDNEYNEGHIIREDWTGDSKISDADRQELENLFEKLNTDESSEKNDVTRSIEEEDGIKEKRATFDGVASDYAAWLMEQSGNKLGAALKHKADVDHSLTQIFFEDKRGTIPQATKRHKTDDDDRPSNVKYPEPPHWMPRKKSIAPKGNETLTPKNMTKSNGTVPFNSNKTMAVSGNKTAQSTNCSSFECVCSRACFPKPYVTASPCHCKESNSSVNSENSDAKNLILQGSKLCTDDSPRCLCTRACYPKAVSSYAPCNCEGDPDTGNKKQNLNNGTFAVIDKVKAVTPDTEICNEQTPECNCKKMCHPKSISEVNPCKCSTQPPTSGTSNNAAQNITSSKQNDTKPVNTNDHMNNQTNSSNVSVINVTSKEFKPSVNTIGQPVMSLTSNFATTEITEKTIAQANYNNMLAAPNQAMNTNTNTGQYNSLYSTTLPFIGQSVNSGSYPLTANFMGAATTNAALLNAQQSTNPVSYNSYIANWQIMNDTKANQRTVLDPLALSWCKRACNPLGVATENPCKCMVYANNKASAPIFPVQMRNKAASPMYPVPVPNKFPSAMYPMRTPGVTQFKNPLLTTSAQTRKAAPFPNNLQQNTEVKFAPASLQPKKFGSFPPKSPVIFPPRAPAVVKSPIPGAKIPLNIEVKSGAVVAPVVPQKVPNVSPKSVVNVVGPSAGVVPAPNPIYYSSVLPAIPYQQVVAFQPKVKSAVFNAKTNQISNIAAAAVMPQTQTNKALYPAAVPSSVNADARQAVYPNTNQPFHQAENSCTRSCYPAAALRNDPCICAALKKNKAVNGTVSPQISAGLFGTNAPIYTNHPSYQGCFKDRMPVRDLAKRFTRFDTTPEACISECKYQNYKFAGVQYGYLCFCGDAFGRYGRVKDTDCNSRCNGDVKRNCGAFWHNSVYSVDGKEYDPTDFDFAKIDAEERQRDALPSPAPGAPKPKPSFNTNKEFIDAQGANLATHLMKAAQAALQAAKKLLPSVSKKHKVHGKGHKRQKVKRENDEEDEELMQEKMASMASLTAAQQILKKTNFGADKRDTDRAKRSIDEDSDPYNPDDGKDLLAAYMSNVDVYKRQVRSVDDEEEDDDDVIDKANFDYHRLAIGDEDEGEFVERYGEEEDKDNERKKRSMNAKRKRSINENVYYDSVDNTSNNMISYVVANNTISNTVDNTNLNSHNITDIATANNLGSEKRIAKISSEADTSLNNTVSDPMSMQTKSNLQVYSKLSPDNTSSNFLSGELKTKNQTSQNSHQKQAIHEALFLENYSKKKLDSRSFSKKSKGRRDIDEEVELDNKDTIKNKRSVSENDFSYKQDYLLKKSDIIDEVSKSFNPLGRSSISEVSGQSVSRLSGNEESEINQRRSRSFAQENATFQRKKQFQNKGSAVDHKSRRSHSKISAVGERKIRFLSGVSTSAETKIHSLVEGSSAGERKRRSLAEGSEASQRKRRSLVEASTAGQRKRRSLVEGSAAGQRKRLSLVEGSEAGQRKRPSLVEGSATGQRKRSSLVEGSAAGQRKRRFLVEGSEAGQRKRRSLVEGSAYGQRKSRALVEGSAAGQRKRRSLNEGSAASLIKRRSLVERIVSGQRKRRSLVKGSRSGQRKRRFLVEGSAVGQRKSRSLVEGSTAGQRKRRSLVEGSAAVQRKRRSLVEGIASGQRRSLVEGSAVGQKKRQSLVERSVGGQRKRRSLVEGSAAGQQKIRSLVEGSAVGQRKRQSIVEGSAFGQRKKRFLIERSAAVQSKRRSLVEGSDAGERKSRSLVEGSDVGQRKIQSLAKGSTDGQRKRRSFLEGNAVSQRKRRSLVKGSAAGERKRRSLIEGNAAVHRKRRSLVEGISTEKRKVQLLGEGSAAGQRKRRSLIEGSAAGQRNIRSLVEGSAAGQRKRRSNSEGSAAGEIKRRSIVQGSVDGRTTKPYSISGSATGQRKKRSLAEGSAALQTKRRSTVEGGAAVQKTKRTLKEGSASSQRTKRLQNKDSAAGQRKRPSLTEGSADGQRKRRSQNEGNVANIKKSQVLKVGSDVYFRESYSLVEGSALVRKKKRSNFEEEMLHKPVKQSLIEGIASLSKKKQDVEIRNTYNQIYKRSASKKKNANNYDDKTVKSIIKNAWNAGHSFVNNIKRAIIGDDNRNVNKTKRALDDNNGFETKIQLPAIAEMKSISKHIHVNDIEENIDDLGSMDKRNEIPEEENLVEGVETVTDIDDEDDQELGGENESGSGLFEDDEDEENTSDLSGEGSGDLEIDDSKDDNEEDDHDVKRRNSEDDLRMKRRDVENDLNDIFEEKRSSINGMPTPQNQTDEEKAHLRSDVEKGVDSLLNLVVELYKQQKTIKAFESSVRSLRHDILKEINVPHDQKTMATAKIRDEIEKTARERLHVLTSSIEHKITEFAKTHPEAAKQATLASNLLPKLPLGDTEYSESKKEITRRSSEFDDIEDSFTQQNQIPNILREHFKRNSEPDIEYTNKLSSEKQNHGEPNLSRMHRNVQEIESKYSTNDDVDELEKLFS